MKNTLMYAFVPSFLFNCLFRTAQANRPEPKTARKNIGFSPSVQHAKNSGTMVQCTECNKWRLIFSKRKLNKRQVKQLQDAFEDIDYTCGMMLGEWFSVICILECRYRLCIRKFRKVF